ncbi:substrate-binding domain-containing protein [Ferrimicrobium acidiphilum]|uniref:Periplasmic binding protein domain-containing protein n=1 Tax=Ferrimicrobium acidiphilum DSM 19497 TaxID=1121877 RepID=A0A0D8FQN3_9ACTN|nr:substrate-binding domain-containing protein [Ferrimicrobium acidiphilum]KJE75446.1 hypothetical protein FEAC_28220 [Ferrimicrobium acidiphilum DSM 19497]
MMRVDVVHSGSARGRKLKPSHRTIGRASLLAATSALLLAACGSSSSSTSSTKSSAKISPAVASWCGPKPITLGYLDGNGANAWSQESLAQARIAAKECPSVKKMMVVDADFSVQKAVSGMTSLVARGANAIATVPDASPSAELPGIISATQHGVKVVPFAVNPGGSAPKDYVTFVNYNTEYNGVEWGKWLVQALHGHGNVIYLGGPPGNPIDVAQMTGLVSVLKKYPKIKLLTGYNVNTWPVTNWEPALAQTVMSGLLAKYPNTTINAIVTGDGQSTLGALQAFKDSGRPLPDVVGQESNGLACAWQAAKGTSNAFQLAMSSNRNWMAQIAVRKAIAAVNGLHYKVPSTYKLPLYENSLAGGSLRPVCDKSLPMSALTSSILKPLSYWISLGEKANKA